MVGHGLEQGGSVPVPNNSGGAGSMAGWVTGRSGLAGIHGHTHTSNDGMGGELAGVELLASVLMCALAAVVLLVACFISGCVVVLAGCIHAGSSGVVGSTHTCIPAREGRHGLPVCKN